MLRSADMYKIQFTALGAVEMLCIGNYVFFLSEKRMFEMKIKVWIMLLLTMTRLSLISVLFIQQKNIDDPIVQTGVEDIVSHLLIIYMVLIYIGVIVALLYFIYEMVKFFIKCVQKPYADIAKPENAIDVNGKTRFE